MSFTNTNMNRCMQFYILPLEGDRLQQGEIEGRRRPPYVTVVTIYFVGFVCFWHFKTFY